MGITTELKDKKYTEPEVKFPRLRRTSNGVFVLFTAPRVGTVLYCHPLAEIQYPVGEHRDDWIDWCFTDYGGEITLRNGD